MAVALVRHRRHQRRDFAAHSRGLLLQDVHVAADAEVVAALRAPHPARGRNGRRGEPAGSGLLRAPVRALRCAGDRRGTCRTGRGARSAAHAGARVILCDENSTLGGRLYGARRHDRRRRRERMARSDDARARRHTPTSRCWRARRRSATTTAIWSGLIERVADHARRSDGRRSSGSAAQLRRYRAGCRDSDCGKFVPRPSCSRRGRTSAALPTRTTTCRERCWPARFVPTSSATRYDPETRAVDLREQRQCLRHRAFALQRAGVEVAAIVDPRAGESLEGALPLAARDSQDSHRREIGRHRRARKACTSPPSTSRRSSAAPSSASNAISSRCPAAGIPAVHLFSQARGKLRYDEALATFVPDQLPRPHDVAAQRTGRAIWRLRCAKATMQGSLPPAHAGFTMPRPLRRPHAMPVASGAPRALWSTAPMAKGAKRFVDWQNDVTVDDIALGAREGYRLGRAPEALHHARHGDRPGQDVEHRRPRTARRRARTADRRRRHDDLPAAVHAGHARRFSGPRRGTACRAVALLHASRLARRARRALRQCRLVEAAAFVSARRRVAG